MSAGVLKYCKGHNAFSRLYDCLLVRKSDAYYCFNAQMKLTIFFLKCSEFLDLSFLLDLMKKKRKLQMCPNILVLKYAPVFATFVGGSFFSFVHGCADMQKETAV